MKQNATATAKGFIYQFYEAIEWCWKLQEDQQLYIETYGDISVSNEINIEVKNVSGSLTNMGECFWKTLSNWLDDKFDEKEYETLILITTQKISERSLLLRWNDLNVCERMDVIKTIVDNEYSSYENKMESYNGSDDKKPKLNIYINKIRCKMESLKLNNIVRKFLIFDSSLLFDSKYKRLCDVYGKSVLKKNVKSYINAQIGYIISPLSVSNNWVITFDDFRNEIVHLTQTYASGSRIFPKVKNENINYEQYKEYLFVSKIIDINHLDAIDLACADYANALNIIGESFYCGERKKRYDDYLKEVIGNFDVLYRMKSRRCSDNVDFDSQDFYDEFMLLSPPSFSGYESTGYSFRNGVLHIQLDDTFQIKKWRLK
ncbi:hypothetical protein AYY19_00055 [Photobacterium aquimaris]|uniref:hypothetical protein n=1 Tax=Photobacterium aquimaris TaxID=512643 RepID=UPI0007F024C1|nr:hypothetical protein [Photobacterium aquimaris]OBU18316.1 hypothetical protein AYY19_00055 [Photobacterium aquimaris]PSV96977.1 hypothetical protein CTM91_19175 [Photobacterium aquimaris]